jgi:PAS domain S-box-containing protein
MANQDPRKLKNDFASEHDFVIRRNNNLWIQMLGLLTVAFGALFLASARLQHAQHITNWEYIIALVVVLGILGAIGYVQVQRHRDLLLLTEFQNALFTSTARLNFRFCLITKRDGSIVYYDPGFQNMFPEIFQHNHSTLDDLFSRKYLPPSIGEEISRLMQDEKRGVLLLPYTNNGKDVSLVVHVDPLAKPKGYVAIRGREYVERRSSSLGSGDTAAPHDQQERRNMQPSGEHLHAALLSNSPIPMYALDNAGNIIFATPSLEQILGYDAGELAGGRPALSSILYQLPGNALPTHDDFTGNIALLHRSGSLVNFQLRQVSQRDSQGNIIGCYGFLDQPSTAA